MTPVFLSSLFFIITGARAEFDGLSFSGQLALSVCCFMLNKLGEPPNSNRTALLSRLNKQLRALACFTAVGRLVAAPTSTPGSNYHSCRLSLPTFRT